MRGDFESRDTDTARDDLLRLFDFLLDRAQTVEDFDGAQLAIATNTPEVEGHLSRAPFIFRKAGQSPFLRELVMPFRSAGYMVLYEIEDGSTINTLAVRHLLEDDYH